MTDLLQGFLSGSAAWGVLLTLAAFALGTLLNKATGKAIGTLRAVDETTINTLFEVETADGKNLLIPASKEIINSVDAERKEIAVTLPDGLLDL